MTLIESRPEAIVLATTMVRPPRGAFSPSPAKPAVAPTRNPQERAQTADQSIGETTPTQQPSGRPQLDSGHQALATQARNAAVISSPSAITAAEPIRAPRAGSLFDGYLCLVADSLDDMERTRIAAANRLRALTRNVADSDGEMRGLGLDERSPEVAAASALVDGLVQLEAAQTKALEKAMKAHPLGGYVASVKGLGLKQAARLLAAIGDPYWNDLHQRPRTVSELWAYCGLAVTDGRAQRRMKGVKSNWSDTAKMRAYVIAESLVKAGVRKTVDAPAEFDPNARIALTDFGQAYIDRRKATANRTHETVCVRCGPSGKPAAPGSAWSAAHQQADALRIVSKELLKQLWLAARDLHEVAS